MTEISDTLAAWGIIIFALLSCNAVFRSHRRSKLEKVFFIIPHCTFALLFLVYILSTIDIDIRVSVTRQATWIMFFAEAFATFFTDHIVAQAVTDVNNGNLE